MSHQIVRNTKHVIPDTGIESWLKMIETVCLYLLETLLVVLVREEQN